MAQADRFEARGARLGRRAFLAGSAHFGAGLLTAGVWGRLFERAAEAGSFARLSQTATGPYGPLAPVADLRTGLPLLKLPAGFSYRTLAFNGDLLTSGAPMPLRPDGMACFSASAKVGRLVRNHEVLTDTGSFAPPAATYDPVAGGATTVLDVDLETGEALRSHANLGGTLVNCAGGPTPWGTWLTCEETVVGVGNGLLQRPHGYVFESRPFGPSSAEPLLDMGRFRHEAAAVDPQSGCVYLTEDATPAGFYRFTPRTPGTLANGGRLEMLRVKGTPNADLAVGQAAGATFDVEWVRIDTPDTTDPAGAGSVFAQGSAQGGAAFARLEGIWFDGGRLFFASTTGGAEAQGQIYEYVPAGAKLRLVFESPSSSVLSNPDNLTVSPRGGIAVCEDGTGPTRLHGLSVDGRIFPFVESAIVLDGSVNLLTGDHSGSEFCGVCYDPTGTWMFFNSQEPGITFAVTGPWGSGAL
jgi:secreted PhoX family phosphatase